MGRVVGSLIIERTSGFLLLSMDDEPLCGASKPAENAPVCQDTDIFSVSPMVDSYIRI